MTKRSKRRGRGRPSAEAGPAISRMELLEAAARLIGERGFAGASIRSIAAAAGVTYGTLQNHFPTKQALWEAIVDEVILPTTVQSLPRAQGSVADTITALIRRRVQGAIDFPGLSGAILIDTSEGAQQRLDYLAKATAPMRTVNLKMMERLAGTVLAKDIDPRSIAVLVGIAIPCLSSATLTLRALFGLDLRDEPTRSKLADDLASIILYGILPRDSEAAKDDA